MKKQPFNEALMMLIVAFLITCTLAFIVCKTADDFEKEHKKQHLKEHPKK